MKVELTDEELKALEFISNSPRRTSDEVKTITKLSSWKNREAIGTLKGYGLINDRSPFSVKEHLQEDIKLMLKNIGEDNNGNRDSQEGEIQETERISETRTESNEDTNQEENSSGTRDSQEPGN